MIKAILVLGLGIAGSLFAAKMTYVEIRTADGKVRRFSRLVMGTDHLGQGGWTSDAQPEPTKEEIHAALDEAVRHGINLFDTAPIYVGGVEFKLGEWRKSRLADAGRPEFYLAPQLNPDRTLYALSKGGFPYDLFHRKHLPAGCHSADLIAELKRRGILDPATVVIPGKDTPLINVPPGTYASHLFCDKDLMIQRISDELAHTCRNLGCGIDVYLMHRDDGDAIGFARVKRPQTPVERILAAVSSREISGHVGMVGWSNWETSRVNESIRLANGSKDYVRPTINSPYFSLLEMEGVTIHALGVQVTHAEMMDPDFQPGIQIMPYSPLGGFSILDKPSPVWENAKAAAYEKFKAKDPYWQNVYPAIFSAANEARWRRAEKFLVDFNAKHHTKYTFDQLLNAYVLAHTRTDLLAIGALTVEQVRRTVGALELAENLSRRDLDFLHGGSGAPSLGIGAKGCLREFESPRPRL